MISTAVPRGSESSEAISDATSTEGDYSTVYVYSVRTVLIVTRCRRVNQPLPE
jgi:hypothetical protein